MHKTKYPFCLFTIKEDGARVIWEVTNSCNYSCSYCIFSSKRGNTQYDVSTDRMKETLHELRDNNVKYLKITGGEPFVRGDLIEILQYASDIGFEIDISTNASFLTEEKIIALTHMNISYVHVSLDGHNKETQEYIRGKGTFEPTIQGIRKLLQHGIHVRVGTVLYSHNEHHVEDIIQYVVSLGVQHIIFSYMEPVGKLRDNTTSTLLAKTDQATMTATLEKLQKTYSSIIQIDFSFVEDATSSSVCNQCPGGKEFMFLDHKGQLSACTWIAEYFPQFISKDTLHTKTFGELLSDTPMKSYHAFIEKLATYGIIGCPKKNLSTVQEILAIDTFLVRTDKEEILQKKFTSTYALYSFTTENIAGYLPQIDCKNKSIVTIGGSGDHIFNAYFQGASHVHAVEKNIFAKYFVELKRQAIRQLSYQEFISFLGYTGDSTMFAYDIYQSIRQTLSVVTQYFRDHLYALYDNSGYKLRQSVFFNTTHDILHNKIQYNLYLTDEGRYTTLQNILHTKTLSRETKDITTYIPESTYDIILLSNISDYTHLLYGGDNHLQTYKDSIITRLTKTLSHGGVLQCAYIYDYKNNPSDKTTIRHIIDDATIRNTIFPSSHYKTITFSSALMGEDIVDAIIYYIKP